MAKQLSITISASDKASAIIRGVSTTVGQMGGKVLQVSDNTKTMGQKIAGALTSVKAAVAGIGIVLAARGIVGSFNETAEALDKIAKKARLTGMAAEDLSVLAYAAKLANTDFDALSSGVSTLQKRLGEVAQTGKGKAKDALYELGVNFKSAGGQIRPLKELLPDIADRLASIQDPAQKAYLASRLFGEQWEGMANTLDTGSAAFRRAYNEANRLGAVFTKGQVESAEAYNDALTRIGQAIFGLKAKLVIYLAPTLAEIADKMAALTASLPNMVKNLTQTIANAIGNDDEAARKLRTLMDSLVNIVAVGVKAAARTALAVLTIAVPAVLDALSPAIRRQTLQFTYNLGVDAVAALAEGMANAAAYTGSALLGSLVPATKVNFDKARDDAKAFMAYMVGVDATINGIVNKFDTNVNALSGDSRELTAAIAKNAADFGAAGTAVLDAVDAIVQYRKALKDSAVGTQLQIPSVSGGATGKVSQEISDWKDGVREGWDDLVARANNYRAQAREIFNSVSEAMTAGLSQSIVDVLRGVKNMKEAFRDWASATLAQVAQLITQMLLLRALAGIGGALFGAGDGVKEVGSIGGAGAGSGAAYGGSAFALRGGIAGMEGVRRYASGTMAASAALGSFLVPGPNIPRDIVPAMLAPGEAVLTRGEVASVGGPSGLRRTLNEAAGGGGGGMVINSSVNVTLSVSGEAARTPEMTAASVKQAVKEASVQGLMETLRDNPRVREQLRKALG